MPHRRNQTGIARSFMLKTAFFDRQRHESISLATEEQVIGHVSETFGPDIPVDLSAIPKLEKGTVLTDTRGQGAFQDKLPNSELQHQARVTPAGLQ